MKEVLAKQRACLPLCMNGILLCTNVEVSSFFLPFEVLPSKVYLKLT